MKEITKISPEGTDIANAYLTLGSIAAVAKDLEVSEYKVVEILNKNEVKRYIDAIYLDQGFRNRNKIAEVLDTMINSKLEEALESGMYSNKDLADLLMMAHKMRQEEIKAQQTNTNIKTQTNVQIYDAFGGSSNYGKLLKELWEKDE